MSPQSSELSNTSTEHHHAAENQGNFAAAAYHNNAMAIVTVDNDEDEAVPPPVLSKMAKTTNELYSLATLSKLKMLSMKQELMPPQAQIREYQDWITKSSQLDQMEGQRLSSVEYNAEQSASISDVSCGFRAKSIFSQSNEGQKEKESRVPSNLISSETVNESISKALQRFSYEPNEKNIPNAQASGKATLFQPQFTAGSRIRMETSSPPAAPNISTQSSTQHTINTTVSSAQMDTPKASTVHSLHQKTLMQPSFSRTSSPVRGVPSLSTTSNHVSATSHSGVPGSSYLDGKRTFPMVTVFLFPYNEDFKRLVNFEKLNFHFKCSFSITLMLFFQRQHCINFYVWTIQRMVNPKKNKKSKT